jgi:hypothetical protein
MDASTKEEGKIMIQQHPKYEVKIERRKKDEWTDHNYYWLVNVYVDVTEDDGIGGSRTRHDDRIYELRGSGFTYRLETAKKKAIKHILSVDKELRKGVTFGIIYSIDKGTASEVVGKLKK